jgi:hypothetical protein
MSSWPANKRCSGPTQTVMMAEVKVVGLHGLDYEYLRTDDGTYLPTDGLV